MLGVVFSIDVLGSTTGGGNSQTKEENTSSAIRTIKIFFKSDPSVSGSVEKRRFKKLD